MLVRLCEKCGKRIDTTGFCHARCSYTSADGSRYKEETVDLCFNCTEKVREFIKKGEN